LDLLISEVERRFDQPGLSRMATLENMLSSDEISEDAHEVLAIYDDVDANKFILERRMLPNLYAASQSQSRNAERAQDAIAPQCMPKTVYEWANYFAAQLSTVRQLFSETIKIVQMLLVVPASAASAERTFSSLRRLKTWLRRTMTQKRLTHLALLHCHRQRVENVDIERLCKDFAFKTNERLCTFGFT
jgi:hypothetical protein